MKKYKQQIGEKVLKKRMSMEDSAVLEKSQKIMEQLMRLELFKTCRVLMCYVDFRKEVATRAFLQQCLDMGKRVAVPLVLDSIAKTGTMAAVEIFSLEKDLSKGNFGIMEPGKDPARRIAPRDLDMVIVPGVAFDPCKNRIGYGGGYYDRFLKQVGSHCFKVGVCFEIQMVSKIPAGIYDVPLDLLITEERIIS